MASHRGATAQVERLDPAGPPPPPGPHPGQRTSRRPASPRRQPRAARTRASRLMPMRVLSELLLAAGLVVLLFLVWKLGWNDWLAASAQTASASRHSTSWASEPPPTPHPGSDPVVGSEPEQQGTVIGVLRVPRFGAAYARTIAQGVGSNELSSFALGVGHYPGTAMPGAVGNFAIAGHRSAYGGAMHVLDTLRRGDRMIVETRDGWYTYRFVREIVVDPDAVGVLAPDPAALGAAAGSRVITVTTCTPLYSTAQRIAAFGVLDSFRARARARAAGTGTRA